MPARGRGPRARRHAGTFDQHSFYGRNAFPTELLDAVYVFSTSATMWLADQNGFGHYILRHFMHSVYYNTDAQPAEVFAVTHQGQ